MKTSKKQAIYELATEIGAANGTAVMASFSEDQGSGRQCREACLRVERLLADLRVLLGLTE